MTAETLQAPNWQFAPPIFLSVVFGMLICAAPGRVSEAAPYVAYSLSGLYFSGPLFMLAFNLGGGFLGLFFPRRP